MSKEKNWIEFDSASNILISLLDGKKNYTQLTADIKKSNYNTLNKTLKKLNSTGLINDKKDEITKEGKYVGVPRYIWLTPIGKRIAEKLVELEEILEEK